MPAAFRASGCAGLPCEAVSLSALWSRRGEHAWRDEADARRAGRVLLQLRFDLGIFLFHLGRDRSARLLERPLEMVGGDGLDVERFAKGEQAGAPHQVFKVRARESIRAGRSEEHTSELQSLMRIS